MKISIQDYQDYDEMDLYSSNFQKIHKTKQTWK